VKVEAQRLPMAFPLLAISATVPISRSFTI